jgi:hypothetical protein
VENQHRLIKTYRELSKSEIDAINECKVSEAHTLALINKRIALYNMEHRDASDAYSTGSAGHDPTSEIVTELYSAVIEANTALSDLHAAKRQIQTGYMWLVRSIARPSEPALEYGDS